MKKYKNNSNGKIAIILYDRVAGMCRKTLGITYVIFKYEEDDYDYPFIMEGRNFNETHVKISDNQ